MIAPHRDGGQAQFLERPVDQRDSGSISPLLDKMRCRLGEPLRIAEMARLVAMSERTFMRRFRATTGSRELVWIGRASYWRARNFNRTPRVDGEHGGATE